MSRHRALGLASFVVSMIDNWVAWCHTGKGVVPRDFHRDADLHEERPPVVEQWAIAVEAIYRKRLDANQKEATVLAAMIFGARQDRIKALGVPKREADQLLWRFAQDVMAIDLARLPGVSKLTLAPEKLYKISEDFGDLKTPLPRAKVRRGRDGALYMWDEKL